MKLNLATTAALIASSNAFTIVVPSLQTSMPKKLNAVDPKDDSKDESITTPISSPPPGYVCEGDICRFVGSDNDKTQGSAPLFAEGTFTAKLESEKENDKNIDNGRSR